VGGFLGYQVLRSVARNSPQLAFWIVPLLVLYVLFVIMTWVSSPLFDLLLRLNRFGRLALSREQIITSNWVAICVLGVLGSLVLWLGLRWPDGPILALIFVLLIPPLSTIYRCETGWPRTTMCWMTVVLASAGLGSMLLAVSAGMAQGEAAQHLDGLATTLFFAFLFGALASQFAANALISAVPRR
jgi:hypothetical protein